MDEKKKVIIIVAFGFFIAFSIASLIAAQFTAYELNYQEALMGEIYTSPNLDFKIYNPYVFWKWMFLYLKQAPDLFSKSFSFFAYSFFIMCIVIFIIRHFLFNKVSDNYGSAHWATKKEIEETKLLDGKGVFVGALSSGEYLRENEKTHDLIVAPTRGGKGVGIVIPTCFSWPHSLFVIDPKGESWENTASWRKEHLKNIVYIFQPGKRESCHYNFLDQIRFGTWNEVKDVDNISRIIVDPLGEGLDHWRRNAASLLKGIILYVKYMTGYVSIKTVIPFLTDLEKGENLQSKLLKCAQAPHEPTKEIFKRIYGEETEIHPIIKQIFTKQGLTPEKEFGSIYSTLDGALDVFRDPIVAENTSYSDFLVEDLMDAQYPISVFFVVTPEDLGRLGGLMRIIVELIYRRNTEKLEKGKNGSNGNKRRVLLLLDEFPALGKMESFETALAFIAGYGIKTMLITQSLNQINRLYTDKNSLFDNAHVRVFFTPNDKETPKFISDMLGKETRKATSKDYSAAVFKMLPSRVSEQEMGRELMKSEEISTMSSKNSIIFVAGHKPIFAEKIYWYDDSNFKPKEMKPPKLMRKTNEEIESQLQRVRDCWVKNAVEIIDKEEDELISNSIYSTKVVEEEEDQVVHDFKDNIINPF